LEYLPTIMRYINDGYMAECSFETEEDRDTLRILFREPQSEPQNGLECTIWFDESTLNIMRAELSYNGAMVLHSDFISFTIGGNIDETGTDKNLGGD